jgi:hypothetical protein
MKIKLEELNLKYRKMKLLLDKKSQLSINTKQITGIQPDHKTGLDSWNTVVGLCQ